MRMWLFCYIWNFYFYFFKPDIGPISIQYIIRSKNMTQRCSPPPGRCRHCAAGRWRHLPRQSADGRNTAGNPSLIRQLCEAQASPTTSRHVMSRPLMFLGTRRGQKVFKWSPDNHVCEALGENVLEDDAQWRGTHFIYKPNRWVSRSLIHEGFIGVKYIIKVL